MSFPAKTLILTSLLCVSSLFGQSHDLDDIYRQLQLLVNHTQNQSDADYNIVSYIDDNMYMLYGHIAEIYEKLDELLPTIVSHLFYIEENTGHLVDIDETATYINDNILASINQLESIRYSVEDISSELGTSLNHLVANSDFFVNNWPPNYQQKLDEIKEAIQHISTQFRQEPFISVNVPGLSVVVDALEEVANQISQLDIEAVKSYLDSIENYNRRQTNYQLEIGHVLVGYTNMFGQLIGFIPDAYDENGNIRKDVVRQISRDSVDLGTNAPPAVDYSTKEMDIVKTNVEHLVSTSDSQDSDGRTLLNEWRVHQVQQKVDSVLNSTESSLHNLSDSVDLPNQLDNYEIRGIRVFDQELETYSLNTAKINTTRSVTETYLADIVYRLLQYATVVFMTMRITKSTLKDVAKNPSGV